MIPGSTAVAPPRRNSEAELDAFEEACMRLAGFDHTLTPYHVDGWLIAFACGPVRPPAETWLPLLAGDAFDRAFGDPPDRAQALAALQKRLDVLHDELDAEALLAGPDVLRLDPYFDEWDDVDRQRLVEENGMSAEDAAAMQPGVLWAGGVLAGLQAMLSLWQLPEGDDEFDEIWSNIVGDIEALVVEPGSDHERALAEMRGAEAPLPRDALLEDACFALQDLRVFLLDHGPKPEQRRVEAPPGRNDPCPCGSGRKYKKCHGAA